MSEAAKKLAAPPDEPEGQLDLFDRNNYKVWLFDLKGVTKHSTEINLEARQVVSGRFWGVVSGFKGTGFIRDTDKATLIFEITADRVELDD